MLAEAASQATKSKVSYLELMLTPASKISRQVEKKPVGMAILRIVLIN
jgi:hypothetical protein